MKLQLASDIHTEFQGHNQGRKVIQRIAKDTSLEVEAILVPGDLSTIKGLRYAFSLLCDLYENVIYCTGNHEYYKSNKNKTEDLINECCVKHSNLHWLNRSSVTINNQRFIGTTLWHPSTHDTWVYRNNILDNRAIKDYYDWVPEEFELNKKYLKKNIKPGDVLLTHHLPSSLSIAPKYKNSGLNCFFVGDISEIIRETKPQLVVHGHTHCAVEYDIYNTKVVCNPLGYPQEFNTGFNYSKVVEI